MNQDIPGEGTSFKAEEALSIDFRTKVLNLLEPELLFEARGGGCGRWVSNAVDMVRMMFEL